MAGPEFHQTRMGQRHYEVTMPNLVKNLATLNDTLQGVGGQLTGLNTKLKKLVEMIEEEKKKGA